MARKKVLPSDRNHTSQGTLIIIGGREDRRGKMQILAEVARRIGNRKLCIATVASTIGAEIWEEYREAFKKLGVKKISHLDVLKRHEREDIADLKAVKGAAAVFFSGGDQLRITSELGGTEIADEIYRIFENGGVIAGTSAGASVMGETMMVAGKGEASFRVGADLRMSPGLGFVKNMIIDQHFAERGRIGRLIGAIAHHPKYLGVGIDEDTAIIVEHGSRFRVMGTGAVYVLDAHGSSDCNLSEASEDDALSIFNVRFHLLSEGDEFDLLTRTASKPRKVDRKQRHKQRHRQAISALGLAIEKELSR